MPRPNWPLRFGNPAAVTPRPAWGRRRARAALGPGCSAAAALRTGSGCSPADPRSPRRRRWIATPEKNGHMDCNLKNGEKCYSSALNVVLGFSMGF